MQLTQAMILAAGKGSRMRPLTLTTPKPLIAVAGQPLIVWHILALQSAGVTDITINCAWLADILQEYLGDGSAFGVRIHWSKEEGDALETAGGIKKALVENKLRNEPFILVNGDVWTTYDFSALTNVQLPVDCLAHLLLIDNPEHNPDGDFILRDGKAMLKPTTNEKSDNSADTAYTFAGISVINPQLLNGIVVDEPYPLAPLLKNAMLEGTIEATHITDTWVDVGTTERLAHVNDYIANELADGVHMGMRP